MNQDTYTVAFSGHRPSSDPARGAGRSAEALRACRGPLREVFARIRREAQAAGKRMELTASLAAGADLEAAEAAEAMGLPLHVVLPLPVAEFAKDFGGDLASDWPRAERQIERALQGASGGSLQPVPNDAERPRCYAMANEAMLNRADALVVVWNRHPDLQPGGTADMVRRAKRQNCTVVVIDPASPSGFAPKTA